MIEDGDEVEGFCDWDGVRAIFRSAVFGAVAGLSAGLLGAGLALLLLAVLR